MCGIIGFIGNEDAVNHITDGLTILENRGYDSAGLVTLDLSQQLVLSKFASTDAGDAINQLKAVAGRHSGHTLGIGHTRWATHGPKTDANAHPHLDSQKRLAVVHNGVITNYAQLKQELQAAGITFVSQTDTEVIAQLIGHHLDHGLELMPAVRAALSQLEGTWGLAIISPLLPDAIIVAKNGSPLVIGVAENKVFIASEPVAFGTATRDFIALKNGEIAVVRANQTDLDLSRIEKAAPETIAVSPAPHPHWTIKEILEQPEAVSRTLNHGARLKSDTEIKLGGLESRKAELLGIQHLIIAACGTSFHAGLYAAQSMRTLHAFESVQVVDASELTPQHFTAQGTGLLVISQSGETKDVHRAVIMAQELGVPVFSVINAVGSLIARATECGVYLNAGRERAVASTKAFVTQVTALELVAIWFAEQRGVEIAKRRQVIAELRRLPTNLTAALKLRDECRALAATLINTQHMFILGKGFGEAIAKEGALKIKEITYLHAEGYAGGALKHGPFALIEPGTPVILIILDDQHANHMRTAAEEVRARGARTIVITDRPELAEHVADDTLLIPKDGSLAGLLATVPLQLIAYELAVLKGLNPDKPRNLAKAVTVD
jgi:glucosamine--fructose-6-phosphate aminotransferase (isomerizing)